MGARTRLGSQLHPPRARPPRDRSRAALRGRRRGRGRWTYRLQPCLRRLAPPEPGTHQHALSAPRRWPQVPRRAHATERGPGDWELTTERGQPDWEPTIPMSTPASLESAMGAGRRTPKETYKKEDTERRREDVANATAAASAAPSPESASPSPSKPKRA